MLPNVYTQEAEIVTYTVKHFEHKRVREKKKQI